MYSYLECSDTAFKSWFPTNSPEYATIKQMIALNCVNKKQYLRSQWIKETSSSSAQICLYKLMATDEELDRLNDNRDRSPKDIDTNPRFIAPQRAP
jgi:hypothetical protein